MRLTGLDVQENQARRLLNDLDTLRARRSTGRTTRSRSSRTTGSRTSSSPRSAPIPRELRGKLEPAQVFHEVLDHRWFVSREQNRDVPITEAAASYVETVLRHRPDELAVLGASGLADTEDE